MDNPSIPEDLSIMRRAVNYRRSLFGLVQPYLRGDVLEIGAGIGNLTELALAASTQAVTSYTALEPDAGCRALLAEVLAPSTVETRLLAGTFPEAVPDGAAYDLIFSFNVMEHIEEDLEAFRTCRRLLRPQGTLFVLVPAFQTLYGTQDRMLGHHRRYTKRTLSATLARAGFQTTTLNYTGVVGFFGWFLNNRILRVERQNAGQVGFFDRVVLPIQSRVERLLPPPFGQSVYAVATALNFPA